MLHLHYQNPQAQFKGVPSAYLGSERLHLTPQTCQHGFSALESMEDEPFHAHRAAAW